MRSDARDDAGRDRARGVLSRLARRSRAEKFPHRLFARGMTDAAPSSTLRRLETMTGINTRGPRIA
jgi:hypothetical protein